MLTYDAENRQVKVTDNTSGNETTTATTEQAAGDEGCGFRDYGVCAPCVRESVGEVRNGSSAHAALHDVLSELGSVGQHAMVTGAAGAVVARNDYLPFGVEILGGSAGRTSLWGTTDNVAQKFTGQERDGETGSGYACDIPGC